MRFPVSVAAVGLALLTSCTSEDAPESELFTGHERTYLTLNLAENATQIDILQKLHEDDRQSAIETLQFELDARVLFLTEVLAEYSSQPEVQEKRNQIACHLQVIARYREQHGSQAKYPDIAEMATEALRHAPECECSQGESTELASQRRPTSGCS